MVTTAYQWMNMYKALREIKQLILHINKKNIETKKQYHYGEGTLNNRSLVSDL